MKEEKNSGWVAFLNMLGILLTTIFFSVLVLVAFPPWLLVYGFAFAVIAAIIADRKGLGVGTWYFWGWLFGIFAVAVVAMSRSRDTLDRDAVNQGLSKDHKKCPRCAEVIKIEATKCRYCASDFVPFVEPPPMVARSQR